MIDEIDLLSDDEARNTEDLFSLDGAALPSRQASNYTDDDSPPTSPCPAKRGRKAKGESKTALMRKERELRAQERKRKQAMKPGNCMKLIKVILTADLLQNDYAGDLILALNKADIAYRVDVNSSGTPSIQWERQDPFDEESVTRENHLLVFMHAQEFLNLISLHQLNKRVEEMQSAMKGCRFTLTIYDLENYFRFHKTKKNREFRDEVRGQNTKTTSRKGGYNDAPVLSREVIEGALAELQIMYNCGHCIFNQPSSVASYVCQYTKAVAEAPYKHEKKGKEQEQLDWFALADSRGTVRVDKQGTGLARLWRQQLCQFNLAGLDSSEAIAHAYPSPKALTEAYDGLPPDDAALLLQNIQLRRGAGPLASERRIGPQLSRKMHAFFTGENGNSDLSKD